MTSARLTIALSRSCLHDAAW